MPAELTLDECLSLFPEITEIANPATRDGVIAVWQQTSREMLWEHLTEVPKNAVNEKQRSLVDHVRGVTALALAIAEIVGRLQGKAYDRDLLLAACLLHDVSKVLETEPESGSLPGNGSVRAGVKSRIGRNMPHGSYGAHLALSAGLSLEVANLIITHTHKSNVRGTTWEAAVLFYADYAETDASLNSIGSRMFLQRWLMD